MAVLASNGRAGTRVIAGRQCPALVIPDNPLGIPLPGASCSRLWESLRFAISASEVKKVTLDLERLLSLYHGIRGSPSLKRFCSRPRQTIENTHVKNVARWRSGKFSYWLGILRREPSLVDGSDEGEPDIDQSWRQASCCVAKFFVPALVRAEKVLLDLEVRRGSDWFPFTKHGLNGMANLCTPDYGFDAAVERRLLSEFLSGIWDLHFMTVVGSPVLGKTPRDGTNLSICRLEQ